MYIEDADQETVGEVHQKWHLWRRKYELFVGKKQFAEIDGDFLAWEFLVRDQHGQPLALIDRNFSGFGKELFTDAGKYAIHFGESPESAAKHISRSIESVNAQNEVEVPRAELTSDSHAVIPCTSGNQLIVRRTMELDERMIALAAAISIDYDFFSRHSYGSGMLSPFIYPPVPMPMPAPTTPEPAVDSASSQSKENFDDENQNPSDERLSSWDDEILEDDADDDWQDSWGQEDSGGSIFDLFNWDEE